MSIEDRRAYCGQRVTLNGHPAVIAGAQNDFATVVDLTTGAGFEWSWDAVSRVVAADGRFTS